eukprot:gnl/Chilomastix_cuspidata/4398.p1 GENE.gnl/Chilomastix_cuspidata/4398~~gnl/Chilomastix_cuspidata/4398.p1  ORF type:complete len:873 (+),score=261.67 gnl/Chilomastix_cuspidata/4398:43-2661(+)
MPGTDIRPIRINVTLGQEEFFSKSYVLKPDTQISKLLQIVRKDFHEPKGFLTCGNFAIDTHVVDPITCIVTKSPRTSFLSSGTDIQINVPIAKPIHQSVSEVIRAFHGRKTEKPTLMPDGSLSLFNGEFFIRGTRVLVKRAHAGQERPPYSVPVNQVVEFSHDVTRSQRAGHVLPSHASQTASDRQFLVSIPKTDALGLCFQSGPGKAEPGGAWPGTPGLSPFKDHRRLSYVAQVEIPGVSSASCVVPEPLEAVAILGLHKLDAKAPPPAEFSPYSGFEDGSSSDEPHSPRATAAPTGLVLGGRDRARPYRSHRSLRAERRSERTRKGADRHVTPEFLTSPHKHELSHRGNLYHFGATVRTVAINVWRIPHFLRISERPVPFLELGDGDNALTQSLDEQLCPGDFDFSHRKRFYLWIPPSPSAASFPPRARAAVVRDLLSITHADAPQGEQSVSLAFFGAAHCFALTLISRGQQFETTAHLVHPSMKSLKRAVPRILGDFGVPARRPIGWAFFDMENNRELPADGAAVLPQHILVIEIAPTQMTLIPQPKGFLDPFAYEDAFPDDGVPDRSPDASLSLLLVNTKAFSYFTEKQAQHKRTLHIDQFIASRFGDFAATYQSRLIQPSPSSTMWARLKSPSAKRSPALVEAKHGAADTAAPLRPEHPPAGAHLRLATQDASPGTAAPGKHLPKTPQSPSHKDTTPRVGGALVSPRATPGVKGPSPMRPQKGRRLRYRATALPPTSPSTGSPSDDYEEATYMIEYIAQRKTVLQNSHLWRSRPRGYPSTSRFYPGLPLQQFLIKWQGYGASEATWEPEWNLDGQFPFITAFDMVFGRRTQETVGGIATRRAESRNTYTQRMLSVIRDLSELEARGE